MKDQHPKDDSQELAALHALGMMSDSEAKVFEEHLAGGCPGCIEAAGGMDAVLGAMALLSQETPPADLRDRVLASIAREATAGEAASFQVWKNWQGPEDPAASSVLIRSEDGAWESTGIEGVAVRRLFVDSVRKQVTMLIRMEPGTSYPPHRHGGAEECYVIQGDLSVGNDTVMHAGDYQRVETGGVHAVQSTQGGCLLYITSSIEDEILA